MKYSAHWGLERHEHDAEAKAVLLAHRLRDVPVEIDRTRARAHKEQLAALKPALELFQLELGIGVPRDTAQVKAKYKKACGLGFANAGEEREELDK